MDSLDREKILDKLVALCPFVDECDRQCTPADQSNCWDVHTDQIYEAIRREERDKRRKSDFIWQQQIEQARREVAEEIRKDIERIFKNSINPHWEEIEQFLKSR